MIAFGDRDEQYIELLRKSVRFPFYPLGPNTKERVWANIHDTLRLESKLNTRRTKWKRIAAIIPMMDFHWD